MVICHWFLFSKQDHFEHHPIYLLQMHWNCKLQQKLWIVKRCHDRDISSMYYCSLYHDTTDVGACYHSCRLLIQIIQINIANNPDHCKLSFIGSNFAKCLRSVAIRFISASIKSALLFLQISSIFFAYFCKAKVHCPSVDIIRITNKCKHSHLASGNMHLLCWANIYTKGWLQNSKHFNLLLMGSYSAAAKS